MRPLLSMTLRAHGMHAQRAGKSGKQPDNHEQDHAYERIEEGKAKKMGHEEEGEEDDTDLLLRKSLEYPDPPSSTAHLVPAEEAAPPNSSKQADSKGSSPGSRGQLDEGLMAARPQAREEEERAAGPVPEPTPVNLTHDVSAGQTVLDSLAATLSRRIRIW